MVLAWLAAWGQRAWTVLAVHLLTQLWRWREAWSSDDMMGKASAGQAELAWLPPRNLRLDETGRHYELE